MNFPEYKARKQVQMDFSEDKTKKRVEMDICMTTQDQVQRVMDQDIVLMAGPMLMAPMATVFCQMLTKPS